MVPLISLGFGSQELLSPIFVRQPLISWDYFDWKNSIILLTTIFKD